MRGQRLLIFTAPAVMALVAAAVYRLRLAWVRAATVLCLVGWAAGAGFQELNRSGKNAWASPVLQMSRAEEPRIGGIMVYAFGSSDETIAFYLKERHDHRFRTKRVKGVAEMEGDHFWVAARSQSPTHLLVQRGYEVGRGFEDGFGGRLFPVWRP